jgi:Zn-finger nucleic acid-binding protein
MSEVYRQAGGSCPDCASPLREHAKRLVCDQCDGMMLDEAEYTASLRELDSSQSALTVASSEAAEAKCPCCTKPLANVTLAFGGKKLVGRYLRCETDGLWVPNESMIGAYAVVGHRARKGGGSGGSALEAIPAGPGGHGGAIAIRSVASAFANRPTFVALASVTSKVHTAFVSAFAGQEMMCPKCQTGLAFEADRWACKTCAGSFVEDAALVAMVQDITQGFWEMPPIGTATGARGCPACKTPMVVEHFHGIEIDRCKPHGVWFDADELQTVLVESTNPKETGSWLKRLFGRHKA